MRRDLICGVERVDHASGGIKPDQAMVLLPIKEDETDRSPAGISHRCERRSPMTADAM